MKFLVIFLFVFTSVLFAEELVFNSGNHSVVTRIKERSGNIIYSFKLHNIEINKYDDRFSTISSKQLTNAGEIGAPSLPSHSILVSGKPSSFKVTVNQGDVKKLEGVSPVPTQLERSRCDDCTMPSFEYNEDSYQVDSRFFQIESIGDFRGTPISRITFFPVRYQAENLLVYPEMSVEIESVSHRAWNDFVTPDQIVMAKDLNKKFVIITPKDFESALTTFKNWKTNLGYQVSVYQLETIGKNPANIKAFIKDLYAKEKFTYILLVGDEDIFPTEYVATSGSSRTPSDLRYFTMGDSSDFIPDVFAGRLVVANKDDINNQTQKIMEYENQQATASSKVFLGIASSEGSKPSDEEYVKEMYKPFASNFQMVAKYQFEAQGSSDSQITDILSQGVKWVNYVGHGSGTGWASVGSGEYSTENIKEILPNSSKPVVIDVACLNGRFKKQKFGERLMNETANGRAIGAVAYYGGSVSISWNPPAIMAVGMNKMITEKRLTQLGESLLAGQMFLLRNHYSKEEVIDNFEWFHLFGDPSLMLNL